MNSKQLQQFWRSSQKASPVILFVSFVLFGIIAVVALRTNYEHMVKLRQAVYAADEQGGDVEAALEQLRSYVGSHMNTSLSTGNSGVYPPIQLKYTYQRLVQAAGQQASSSNARVYSDAQKYCERQIPTGFSGRYRLDCIEGYVDQHGNGTTPNIPDSLYKFDFVSPRWSPDIAGWSVLAAGVSFVLLIASLVVRFIRR